ncbi:hypothetical protein BLA29_013902 [Euroglyphus maynei]|uniref:Uncharacterized protein n=1 Tax=Euroglyphus maynei TaxID=6958 RepID=A0A1Y3ARQ0_EURMA|nr:hypothetical protein BLA29_013902 [Euroglyphus maynei]
MYRQLFFTSIKLTTRQCLPSIICRHFVGNQSEISTKLQTKIENRLKNLNVEVDLGRGPNP